MNDWLTSLIDGGSRGMISPAETIVFSLLMAFLIGHFIGWVYMWTHKGLSYSQAFVSSLVVIPVVVAMMMALMAGNIVIAFGLLAVFAVVRFRNVLKDTRDTTFILWAIMEGLGIGTKCYSTSLVGAVGVALVLIYLRITAFGARHRYDAVLSLQLTGGQTTGDATLQRIFRQHVLRSRPAGEQRLTDEGLSLSYRLLLRDPSRCEEFRSALRDVEEFKHVSLSMREDEVEI